MSQSSSEVQEDISRKINFVMPFEFDYDFGAANGNAFIGRFLPLISVPVGTRSQFHNLTLAIIANAPGGRPGFPGNPDPVTGEKAFGLGDWVNISTFLPPLNSSKVILGFGMAIGIPIATNSSFGSGKWTIGPSIRIGYNPGRWRLNALGGNLWSFAGDPDRGEVNQMIIRGLIRHPIGLNWFFTSNPIITANWNAQSGQRWLLPLGGGIGRRLKFHKKHLSVATHLYYNVIKPDGAPTGLVRLDILYQIPKL